MQEGNQDGVPSKVNEQPVGAPPVVQENLDNAPPSLAIAPEAKPLTKSRKKLWIIISFAVVLAVAGGLVYWFVLRDDNTPVQNAPATTVTEPEEAEDTPATPQIDPLVERFTNPTTGEVWLPAPKSIAKQGFITHEPEGHSDISYFEVGSRAGKTLIISVERVLGDLIYLYERAPDGTVTVLLRPDATATYNDDNEKHVADTFVPSVKIDRETRLDSLTLPDFDLGNDQVAKRSQFPYLGDLIRPEEDTGASITAIKQYGASTLERVESQYPDTDLTSLGYTLKTPFGTRIALSFAPIDIELRNFSWSKGDSYVDDSLSAISRGCGSRFTSVTRANSVTDAVVEPIGKNAAGEPVYHPKDPNHPLYVKAFEEFIAFYKDDTTTANRFVTKEQFVAGHSVVLYKDKAGQWLVYARDERRPIAGCAKPVVYLYPQTTQQVSVRVGADVMISEPFYSPLHGWTAIAQPSGLLEVQGRMYRSLFWEGPGWGEYPLLNEGVVVKTSEALDVIHRQLAEQGLNAQETQDFIDYWKPNLPDKPYIRLTWLNTAQLDRLAPLQISPRPDTVIRVFLDFAGLDTPIDLKPQTFQVLPRTGFTVVEWGGLSQKKLY